MLETEDPAIKLFGKKIPLPAGIDGLGFARPEEKAVQLEVESEQEDDEEEDEETEQDPPSRKATQSIEQDDGPPDSDVNPMTPSVDEQTARSNTANQQSSDANESQENTLKKPDKIPPCPRCNSMDTKFCYYNNYNVNQPRHFCKACQRYWTAGGTMRNVPVGAGSRKIKNSASHHPPIAVSEALQAAGYGASNGANHPSLKSNGRVLSFGVDTGLNLADKRVLNGTQSGYHKSEERVFLAPCKGREKGDDSSSASSVTVSKPRLQNVNGFSSEIPCLPGVPWPYPWNSAVPPPAFCLPAFPISLCPAPYWNSGVPGTWNVPWFAPQPASPNQKSPSSGSNSPTLGKHSRDEDSLKPDNSEKEEQSKQKNGGVLIPKTLRIDDPSEAAKSSIWATLGIKNDSVSSGGLFKAAFQPKSYHKEHVCESSQVLLANPAALCRSLNFHESS